MSKRESIYVPPPVLEGLPSPLEVKPPRVPVQPPVFVSETVQGSVPTPWPPQVRDVDWYAGAAPRSLEEFFQGGQAYPWIVEAGADLVLVFTRSGRILFCSPAAREHIGCDAAELRGRSLYEVLPRQEAAEVRAWAEGPRRSTDRAVFSYCVRHRETGEPVWLQSHFLAAHSPETDSPEPVFVALTWTLSGEPAAAAAAAPVGLGQAAHMDRLSTMAEVASSLAHELKQPLTAISMYTQTCLRLLQSGDADAGEVTDILQSMAAQVNHASEFVKQLRRFMGGQEAERGPADAGGLCREALSLCRPVLRSAQVGVEAELPADLPRVTVDRVQIVQVLVNLIRNAAEAMQETPAGVRALRVAAARRGGEVEVSVRDSGSGLKPGMIDHLFEPWRTTKPQGMGVGLAICRSIIQTHGGRLWAQPNPDRGMTFSFTLPVTLNREDHGSQVVRLLDR